MPRKKKKTGNRATKPQGPVTIDPAQPLGNQRWEVVAQKVAEGKSWTDALKAAGYKSIEQQNRWSSNVGILARVEWLQKQVSELSRLTAADTAKMLRDQALYDPMEIFEVNAEGGLQMRRLDQIPVAIRRMIQSIEIETVGEDVHGRTIKKTKLKLVDRQKSIDMINRMIGAYDADNRQKRPVQAVIIAPGMQKDPMKWAEHVAQAAIEQENRQ